MFKEIIRPALILFMICAVITGSLAYVNGVTKPIIAESERMAEQEGLAKVLPGADSFSEYKTVEQLKSGGINVTDKITKLYEGKKGGESLGYVVEVSTKGYGGAIKMFVGINNTQNVTGVLMAKHNETPGLGSKASDQGFMGQYLGGFPEKEFTVVKGKPKNDSEIQAISGATITSRGVTGGVADAVALIRSMAGGV